jgi:hypothetical protein
MTVWDVEALGLGAASVLVFPLTAWAVISFVSALRIRPRR